MALLSPVRVLQTSATTGTGTYSLVAATAPYQSFNAIYRTGANVPYVATDATGYEIGIGTLVIGSPDTIIRDTIISSSNANFEISWLVGTRQIFSWDLAGSLYCVPYTNITLTATVANWGTTFVYTGANNGIFNLPSISTVPLGFSVSVKNSSVTAGHYSITATPAAGDAIEQLDVNATLSIPSGSAMTFASDGVVWRTILYPASVNTSISASDLTNGVTGSGLVVLATAPTIASPVFSGTVSGSGTIPNVVLANSSLTIAGHVIDLGASQTLAALDLTNGVVGSGAVVLTSSPTIASPTFSGTVAGSGTIPNIVLVHSGMTIAGHSIALGGTQTLAAGDLSDGTSGTGNVVLSNTPTLIAPILGTPTSGVATNLTGTASGLTAGHVTTNANLTGVITSVGNATSIASQTGTGTKFVTDTGPTMSAVTISSGTITGLPTPTNPTDAASKSYVDSVVTGLNVHTSAALATAAALPTNTYANGSSGVGATLTANSDGALTVDGVLVTVSSRVLVKNEAAPANNGIYSVTTVGDVSTAYVLTRVTDFDNTATITSGSYIFVVSGTVNAASGWIMTTTGSVTVGSTGIVFTQFSASTVYLAGSGLTLTGNSFSLTNSAITIAGHSVSLGGTQTISAGDLVNGTSGTGNIVLGTSPTITSPTFAGTVIGAGTVPNSVLVNSSLTIAGHSISLGGTQTLAASDLTNTTIGSGAVVLATSPTIASPTFSGTVVGAGTIPNTVLVHSSMTIAGHSISLGGTQTLAASDLTNTTIGSGAVVLATSPTIASPTFSGTVVGAGTVPNSVLVNSSMTIAGHSISLGGTQTLAAADLTNGVSGSGAVVLATSPALTTPTIGVATGTSLTLTGSLTAGSIRGSVINATAITSYGVLSTDTGKYFDNIGAAGAITFSLPVAVRGWTATFICAVAQTLEVLAPASTTISFGTVVSAVAGNATSNAPFSSITLLAISTTQYVAVASTGTWTIT